MSLCAKDHKDVHGAYKERQKALFKKDFRKGKTPTCPKPWKTSKGYGTRAGRGTYPGRNYGCRGEQFARMKGESEVESDLDSEGNDADVEGDWYGEQTIRDIRTDDSSIDLRVDSAMDGITEQESFDLQLALTLSLSLATTPQTFPGDDADTDIDFEVESLQDVFTEDADDFSLMGTDSEAMDADSEYETDSSPNETDWVHVDDFGDGLDREHPTYAQMTKIEVT